MTCPTCDQRLVEIGVNLRRVRPITMHSCSRCCTQWWDDAEGNRLDLSEVLDLAALL